MITDEKLHTLVDSLPFAAHVRNVTTGRYILANQFQANNHGFKNTQSVINTTYSDIYHHRREKLATLQGSLLLEDEYKTFIDAANSKADIAKEPLCFKACTLFPTGFIYSGILKKIPLFGQKQHVTAMLTFSVEITDRIDLLDLYKLYKKHYPVQQAITQFLQYLRMTQYFKNPPTNQELVTLLILRKNAISKYVARQLGISYRTVEEYKARLRSKLRTINLDGLLVLLRTHIQTPMHLVNSFSIGQQVMSVLSQESV